MSDNYEQMLQMLRSQGWKDGDPVPTELMGASNGVSAGVPQPVQQEPMGPPQTPGIAPPPQAGYDSPFNNPEAVSSILGMGELNRQMSTAEGLRDTEGASGRYTSGGRMFTQANPLEHLAVGLRRYKGGKDTKRIAGEQKDAKQAFIDLLRGGGVEEPSILEGGGPV